MKFFHNCNSTRYLFWYSNQININLSIFNSRFFLFFLQFLFRKNGQQLAFVADEKKKIMKKLRWKKSNKKKHFDVKNIYVINLRCIAGNWRENGEKSKVSQSAQKWKSVGEVSWVFLSRSFRNLEKLLFSFLTAKKKKNELTCCLNLMNCFNFSHTQKLCTKSKHHPL